MTDWALKTLAQAWTTPWNGTN